MVDASMASSANVEMHREKVNYRSLISSALNQLPS
jgi:hypothetical protein